MIHFSLPGKPIALKRGRISGNRIFDSQAKERKSIQWAMKSHAPQKPYSNNLYLLLCFYFSPAKSLSKKKREAMLNTYNCQRPDLDNLIKWILDCGNGILWEDDAQIVSIEAVKVWGDADRTGIHIEEIEKHID